jgi:hypothetical protein
VRHANNNFLHPAPARALDQFVHGSNEALAAFQAETLLAHVLGVQVTLQAFGRCELVENLALFFGAEVWPAQVLLQPLLPPALFGGVGAVHELGADGAAVGGPQGLNDGAQGHGLAAKVAVDGAEADVHVRLGQVVKRGL